MTGSIRSTVVAVGFVWLSAVLVRGEAAERQDATQPATGVPTFTKDVAPILYKNCTTCHRPGEIAPMSLLTYEDARPWVKSIGMRVREGTMPPWHADAPPGTFLNDRRLSEEEKTVILQWANGSAPKGDAKDMPPAPQYADGWALGNPDNVFEMPEEYSLPADGTIQYQLFRIPTNFAEPKWVKAIEVRPGNRAVVHHVLVYYNFAADLGRDRTFRADPSVEEVPPGGSDPCASNRRNRPDLPRRCRLLAIYVPGTAYQVAPEGTAYRLEAGGTLTLEIHYVTNRKAATDRTKIGFILAREPAPKELLVENMWHGSFTLPARAANVEVPLEVDVRQDATVWGLQAHSHLRGKKWSYRLLLPDGTSRTILSVPTYDFNWQTYYMFKEPLQVPQGAKIIATAWYDNSPANKSNPDPEVDVKWGEQTWEEMHSSFVLFVPSQTPTPIVKQ